MPPEKVVTLESLIPLPAAADTRPAFDMPPRKVAPVIEIALPADASSAPWAATRMPSVEPSMIPLSTIEPWTVPLPMAMAVFAEIVRNC
jgi:hypothetical protein